MDCLRATDKSVGLHPGVVALAAAALPAGFALLAEAEGGDRQIATTMGAKLGLGSGGRSHGINLPVL